MNRITKMKVDASTQFAVIGLGSFGMTFARILSENGYNVLVCDNDIQKINQVADFVSQVVQGDINDPAVINSIGLEDFDIVVIAISEDFETSIITTMITKEKNVPFIISKANDWRQEKILLDVGADYVVLPEKDMGERLAQNIITNNPLERLHTSDEYSILEIKPEPSWVGKSLIKLDLRRKYSINIIAVVREDKVLAVLSPDFIIEKNDIIVVLGLDT